MHIRATAQELSLIVGSSQAKHSPRRKTGHTTIFREQEIFLGGTTLSNIDIDLRQRNNPPKGLECATTRGAATHSLSGDCGGNRLEKPHE